MCERRILLRFSNHSFPSNICWFVGVFQAISCHYASSKCHFINSNETVSPETGHEILQLARKRVGDDVTITLPVSDYQYNWTNKYTVSCMCHSVWVIVYVSQCMCHSVCVTVYVSQYMCHGVCVTVYVSRCMCHGVCVTVYVS